MHLLISNIQWDDEGMGLEECALPTVVVMLDVPDEVDQVELEDNISETLSDSFGFCHNGFTWERLNPAHDTHAGGGYFPQRLGLMRWPEHPLER
jgi:hypothetical protein